MVSSLQVYVPFKLNFIQHILFMPIIVKAIKKLLYLCFCSYRIPLVHPLANRSNVAAFSSLYQSQIGEGRDTRLQEAANYSLDSILIHFMRWGPRRRRVLLQVIFLKDPTPSHGQLIRYVQRDATYWSCSCSASIFLYLDWDPRPPELSDTPH